MMNAKKSAPCQPSKAFLDSMIGAQKSIYRELMKLLTGLDLDNTRLLKQDAVVKKWEKMRSERFPIRAKYDGKWKPAAMGRFLFALQFGTSSSLQTP